MLNQLKKNWLIVILVSVIIFLASRNLDTRPISLSSSGGFEVASSKMMVSDISYPGRQVAPSESSNRLIIQDTSLSLQVKDVSRQIKNIEDATKQLGGFLVNSNLSKPEGAASGSITVRVPEAKRAEALSTFKQDAVKVVSESIYGTDVTDQYTDLEAQLAVLNKTKSKFEEILDKAYSVSDLMNVQQQLVNLQHQIDAVKGQQKYYEQSAKLSKVTIYLSTDELALPYAPTNEWRPAVVLKEAVRSLIGNIRGLGNLLIWGVVYSPLIAILIAIYLWYKRRK
jgi:hypothetical protein